MHYMTVKKIFKIAKSAFIHIKHLFKHNQISFSTELSGGCNISRCRIDRYCFIGPNCNLLNVEIGPYCSIAPNVQIGGLEHPIYELSTNTLLSKNKSRKSKTIIGPDVWIAASSIVRQGITIGQGAVVGANSFVNKDVPPYAIVVGSPAHILKYRFDEKQIDALLQSNYYTFPPYKASAILAKLKNS